MGLVLYFPNNTELENIDRPKVNAYMMISRFQGKADVDRDDNNIHTFNNFWELEEHIQHNKSSVGTMQWKDQFCSLDCVSAVKQLGGVLPVSDDVTGDIYVNKLCALCYDVTRTTPWQMFVYCKIGSGYINFINVMLAVSKGNDFPQQCQIIFAPPYQHPRYNKANFLHEDNLRCIKSNFDIFPRKCKEQFEIPLMYNVKKEEIVAACENTSDLFEFGYGLDRFDVFTDKMCAICNGMYNLQESDYGQVFLSILDLDFYKMERPSATEPSTEVCDRTNVVGDLVFPFQKYGNKGHKCSVLK